MFICKCQKGVGQKRDIKELIALSTVKFKEGNDAEQTNENSEEVLKGSYPCGKQYAYCQLLSKSQGQTFPSNNNKKIFKIGQCITCKSKNIIYFATCMKCKLQGIGHSTHFGKSISNYFSHIKKGTHDCEISGHFIEHHRDTWIMAGIQTLK